MSASEFRRRSVTLPRFCVTGSSLILRFASTLRTVSGKIPTPCWSAKRSITPNGDAENLANAGIAPVLTLNGNDVALLKGRFESSFNA